jgi:antitoxin CptB
MEQPISDHEFGKLRWRCRRGLLECDLILDRFFTTRRQEISSEAARDILDLMELDDHTLLALLLGRTALPGAASTSGKQALLKALRPRH